MKFYEILIIIAAVSIVLGNIAVYIYKRSKHLPTGECSCCSNGKRMNKILSNVRNELDKENNCCM